MVFALGLSSLVAILQSYIKYRERILRYFIFFLVIINFRLILDNLASYLIILDFTETFMIRFIFILGKGIFTVMTLCLPFLFHNILPVPFKKTGNFFFGVLTAILLAVEGLTAFFQWETGGIRYSLTINETMINLIFSLYLIYPAFLTLLFFRKTASDIKKIIWAAVLIFISFAVFDNILQPMESLNFYSTAYYWIKSGIQLFIYFSWNAFFLIYSFRYTVKQKASRNLKELTPSVLEQFGISNREREIIVCLLEGKNNREIGNRLFIAENTVKKHVFNIYQKLNVRNRVELINRLGNF